MMKTKKVTLQPRCGENFPTLSHTVTLLPHREVCACQFEEQMDPKFSIFVDEIHSDSQSLHVSLVTGWTGSPGRTGMG